MFEEVDLTTATLEELEGLYVRVQQAISRLVFEQEAPAKAEAVEVEYKTRMDEIAAKWHRMVDTDKRWKSPTGAHNSYPLSAVTERLGKEWESLIPNNVTQPGDPDDPQSYRWWKDLTPVADTAAWSGAGVAYAADDEVVFDGVTFRCVQAHTSQPGWAPVAVPALWEQVAL